MKRIAIKLTDTKIEVFNLSDFHSAWTITKQTDDGAKYYIKAKFAPPQGTTEDSYYWVSETHNSFELVEIMLQYFMRKLHEFEKSDESYTEIDLRLVQVLANWDYEERDMDALRKDTFGRK